MLTLRGIYELARLAVITRFRMRGPYWRWRIATALGPQGLGALPGGERRRAMLEYGRWIARMRR